MKKTALEYRMKKLAKYAATAAERVWGIFLTRLEEERKKSNISPRLHPRRETREKIEKYPVISQVMELLRKSKTCVTEKVTRKKRFRMYLIARNLIYDYAKPSPDVSEQRFIIGVTCCRLLSHRRLPKRYTRVETGLHTT